MLAGHAGAVLTIFSSECLRLADEHRHHVNTEGSAHFARHMADTTHVRYRPLEQSLDLYSKSNNAGYAPPLDDEPRLRSWITDVWRGLVPKLFSAPKYNSINQCRRYACDHGERSFSVAWRTVEKLFTPRILGVFERIRTE